VLSTARSGIPARGNEGEVHGIFAATALVNELLATIHPRMGTSLSAADTSPVLEPPAFLILHYGRSTPLVTVIAHILYEAIVRGFISIAS
jgi:hypothetical protein